MINNRQNGRRRGRGGGPRSPNQGPNPGNRQENRSRGNAAQLHEKYKSLARDAQMQGDRVQTEYWLQFADHYYRLLNENRARFEEQRPRREGFADEEEGEEENLHAPEGEDGEDEREQYQPRGDRLDRDRQHRGDYQDRAARQPQGERQERPERSFRGDGDRPRGDFRRERAEGREAHNGETRHGEGRGGRSERRPPREGQPGETEGERISLDVLPPAIAVIEGDASPKASRRRTRRPRADDGDEIAPAA